MALGGKLCWEGEREGIAIPQASFSPHDYVVVPLTDEHLHFIEARRRGERPTFSLFVTGWLFNDGRATELQSDNSFPPRLDVPRDKWLDLLKQMDYGARRLVELPPPPKALSREFEVVAEHIDSAARYLAIYEIDRSIAKCRLAIEALVGAVGASVGRPRTKTDTAFKNYATAVCAELEERQTPRSSETYDLVAKTIRLSESIFSNASEYLHNGLAHASQPETALLVGLAVSLYSYCARLPMPEPS
jgi:hypothetical protein